MNEKVLLIDWIHKVEYDLEKYGPTKRRSSLVTEVYFERHLSKNRKLNLPSAIAFGWMKRNTREGRGTEWFKIASKDSAAQKQPSLRFVKEMSEKQPQDRFYLIQYEIQCEQNMESDKANLPLAVTFKITSLRSEGSGIFRYTTEEGLRLSEEFTTRITNKLKLYTSTESDNEIGPWLELLSIEELKKLLATRCLMNFSGSYFTDIDGIGINDSGILTFVEFKRKEPARGFRHRLLQNAQLKTYLEVAKNLNKEERKARKAKQGGGSTLMTNQIGIDLNNAERWKRETSNEGCFGLDTSHAENVLLCSDNGWKYLYVIFNHGPAKARELFDSQLSPLSYPDLRCLDVESIHIDGISWADGEKSGSYTKGIPRYQLMIPAENFMKVEL